MDSLRSKYEKQIKDYEVLVDKAVSSGDASLIPRLRELNVSIAKTLNEMIQQMTFLKKDSVKVIRERDDLLDRLRQIQKEYNGLIVNKDTLETLRRIRQEESSEATRLLYLYLFFFLALCLTVFLYLLFATQRKDATAPSASIPPTTAAFV